jgi:hypothetical protein
VLPNAVLVLQNYAATLMEAGRGREAARAIIVSIMTEAGFDPAELWQQVFGDDG